MPKKLNLSSQNMDQWPGILEEIEIKAIPLDYLKTVKVTLTNGEVLNFAIEPNSNEEDFFYIEEYLDDIFEKYSDELEGVDFHLNIEQVKIDIENSTLKFLKERK